MLKKFQATLRWFQSDKRKPVPSIATGQALSLVERSAVQNRKWLGLSVIAFAFAVAGAVAHAQQPAKVPRIGYLTGAAFLSDNPTWHEAFRQGLRELDSTEGKNIVIEWRSGEGKRDRSPALAAELARLKVDVIVTSSVSCESDVIALNLSRLHAATTCPGGPEGFRKAETQTLVSSRATRGTTSCLDLGAGLGDFSLNIFLRYCTRSSAHSAHKTLKVIAPLAFPAQGNDHTRFFFKTNGLKRPKNTIFKDRLKSFWAGDFSFCRRHTDNYSDDLTFGSIAMEDLGEQHERHSQQAAMRQR